MSMKSILFSLTFLAALPISNSYAVLRNTCDDRVDSKRYSDAEIEKCVERFGASDTYKEYVAKKKLEKAAEKASSDEKTARTKNIEFKKFTQKDIEDAAVGQVYAFRLEWKNRRIVKEKRITDGDTLCQYLGYDKATKSGVSENDINASLADQKGFTIESAFFGGAKKEPKIYKSAGDEYTVRKYTEITCAKIISKDIEGTEDELKQLVEKTDFMPTSEQLNPPKENKDVKVNENSRNNTFRGGSTPNGPQIPDYIRDDAHGAEK